ncbi:alginate lyase family protein [Bacillus sp. ISL-47]|uniref:heparinase II/III family protein n=1 Tax=Bacillus sp. ISL-47 TaxID=2819130 RepID=UPI001BEA94FC|nr:heparinase II/III family protein [Bacillus sp. ISL-47]MBT2689217.1 alginate lyase family protein [Bacillus sp. ISL-47]MBT2708662.1 alginate lyase family protein [Pseudomonas sp. ISL-84]
MENKSTLYINTIKYLKPSQIFYRLFNRLKRELYKRKLLSINEPPELTIEEGFNYIIPELDFNKDYLDRFDIDGIMTNNFTFINLSNQVDLSNAWNNKELQHLWRYNLHYFEYLFSLAYEFSKGNEQKKYYDKYRELIAKWIDNNPFPFGDGWHPYTISLRITNWISTYQIFKESISLDKDFDEKLKTSLYLQYKYLQGNLEKDVLGNHYFENIKALIVGSIFFKDTGVKNNFKKELLKQLEEQILDDGMHFELSPMYHKIILEDLLKISYWLKDDEIYNHLIKYIQKMIDVTYSFENNFGKTPAFNDSADEVSKDFKCLLEASNKHFKLNPERRSSFEKSGFYIIEDKTKKLIFDTGDICPSYLPAHGHCDALSFELSMGGSPFIINSGTYRYESGEWRDLFRSTKAHNTVSISDKEQSQFWGSFRVAKRIKKVSRAQFRYKNIEFYAGSYDTHFGAQHKRVIGYINDDKIIVLDYVNHVNDRIKSYLHFVPGTNVDIDENIAHAVKGEESIKLTPLGVSKVEIEEGWYSDQFNVKEGNQHLILHKDRTSKYFGYLIDFSTNKTEIIESKNEVKLISDRDLVIKFEELGDFL